MRTKKFVYNVFTTALLQIVMLLSGVIIPKVMLNVYGSEINGLVSSITQFINYFNLVEAGLSSAAVYALYKPLAYNNIKKINGILSASKKFYQQTGYIFLFLVIIMSCFYPIYISVNVLSDIQIAILVIVLGANGVLEFFSLAKYRVLLTADQKTYIVSLASIAQWIIYTVIIVFCSNLGFSIVLVRLFAVTAILIRTIILMIYCKKRYKYLDYTEKPDVGALNKRWDALYLQILGAVQTGAPVIILTIFVKDLTLVSIYTIYNMVISGVNGVLGIFNNGLSASFGEVIARGELSTLQKSYQEFEALFYAIVGIIYSVCFVMFLPFIKLYTAGVADANYLISDLATLFVISGLVYQMKTPQGMLVISAGLYKETKWQTTIQGIIVIIGGVLFSKLWGINGVLLGYLLANIYRLFDLTFFIPKHVTKLSIKYTVKQYILVLAGMTISVVLSKYLINVSHIDTYSEWIFRAFEIFLIVFAVFLFVNIIFNRKELVSIISRIKRSLKNGI